MRRREHHEKHKQRRLTLAIRVAAGLIVCAPVAHGQVLLAGLKTGLRIDGINAYDYSRFSVPAAGDVNGEENRDGGN